MYTIELVYAPDGNIDVIYIQKHFQQPKKNVTIRAGSENTTQTIRQMAFARHLGMVEVNLK